MSTFSGSYWSYKPLLSNPRPTRMHELLDVDSFQPFEFEGERYYLDEGGFVRHVRMVWTDDAGGMNKPLEDAHILTAIINQPSSVRRSRVVDHVGIIKHLKALGMRYVLRASPGEFYFFQTPASGSKLDELFDRPANVLNSACDLHVPGDSSMKRDLSTIMRGVPTADLAWDGGAFAYAIDIEEYLRTYGDDKPFYEWAV